MLTSWQNPMSTPPFFPSPQAQPGPSWLDRISSGLLGTPAGDMTPEQQQAARQQGLLALGAQLMSAGGPSPTRVSLGQALGQGLLAGQQAQRQYGQDMLSEMLLKMKLQTAGQTSAQKDYQYAIANGYKGTFEDWKRSGSTSPSGIQEYEYAKANGFQGSFEDWKRVSAAQQQTPSAVAEYEYYQKLNPKQQQEFMSLQRQPTTPQIVMVNGVPTLVDKIRNTQTPLTTLQSEIDAAKAKAEGEGEGKARGTATGEAWGALAKKGINALNVMESLDLAEPLIDVATGSGAGAATDKVAAFFGRSLPGDQAIGQLKIIQANLMTNMPRMEGPQSDRDVQLYREAAGELGDPTVPSERKRANLMMIRSLQQKYANRVPSGNGSSKPPAGGAGSDPLGIR